MDKIKELFKFSKTKALGFFIAFAGTAYGFVNTDAPTMISGWGMALFLIGGKTSLNSYLKSKGVN